ncbi:MAG: hypothetical protein JWP72_3631, partial [Massilia sp.]|nr:hypothetical protein [Massilia sp.]
MEALAASCLPMPFRKEPSHTHGSIAQSAIVLANLG